jgi:2',3'-cyclic-nucleotide 2'-phosphodiesterase (5'-nucleotidase family)
VSGRGRGLAVAACVGAAAALCAAAFAFLGAEEGTTILFTGEAACELEVCVCGGEMIGGIAHRGGYLAAREGPFLLFDVGCMGCGTLPDDVLRLEATIRGMAAMGYDAANVGEYELWLGSRRLARLARLGVPLVSANVTLEEGARPLERWLLLEGRSMTAAVTGVVEAGAFRLGAGLAVDDPMEALARVVPEMRAHAELVVVLADLRLERVREAAARFPELGVILFRGRGNSLAPEPANRSIIASVSGLGRHLGDVTIARGAGRKLTASGRPIRIDKRYPADEAVLAASLEWYRRAEKAGRAATSPREERR